MSETQSVPREPDAGLPDGGPSDAALPDAGLPDDDLRPELEALRERVHNLETALVTNRRIAMAIGILMARHGLTEDQAFAEMRSVSQRRHEKLRDIADEVVYTGDLVRHSPGARSARPPEPPAPPNP